MKLHTYFDDGLKLFAELVLVSWGDSALLNNLFLRDVMGRLTFVVLDMKFDASERVELGKKAVELLGNYVDNEDFAVSTPDELFDSALGNLSNARVLTINLGGRIRTIKVVDRRIVGADWLRQPVAEKKRPQRIVFSSIKGGVGRSTALCVVAAHLSAKGRRVLAIDMDIEAPGLGNMLLPEGTLPKFGLLDYLVEQNLGNLTDEFFSDIVGSSWLGGGKGRVDVIPAIGQRSLDNPSNVLGKIARAYLPGELSGNEDHALTFMDHMAALVDRFSDPLRYDVILIDARAGLHETTASAVVGLGANVLFFGMDQGQTFGGYELLLSHLSTLPVEEDEDWRTLFTFVQAKAPVLEDKRTDFKIRISSLFDQYLWPESTSDEHHVNVADLSETFTVDWEVDDADLKSMEDGLEDKDGVEVLAVLDSDFYHQFDPLQNNDLLAHAVYYDTFSMILSKVDQMVDDALSEDIYVNN